MLLFTFIFESEEFKFNSPFNLILTCKLAVVPGHAQFTSFSLSLCLIKADLMHSASTPALNGAATLAVVTRSSEAGAGLGPCQMLGLSAQAEGKRGRQVIEDATHP
ncbi:hypothetical protein SRHO_G00029690 [Serrasalmus rhombeus]